MAEGDGLMRWLGSGSAVLATPLSPAECCDRLSEAVASPWALFSTSPVRGFVNERRARIWKRLWYRNSFQTIMTVRFEPDGSRTRLVCEWGVSIFALDAVVFALAMSGGALWLGREDSVRNGTTVAGHGWILGVILVLMLALLAAIVGFGRLLARGEGDYLRDFLAETIQARVAE